MADEDFDEAEYLAGYGDLAAARAAGAIASGRDHFEAHGRAEGRDGRPRRGKLLVGLDLATTVGLEVGPLDRPVVPKADGRVRYVDHASAEELRARFADSTELDPSAIVDVDAVWGQQTLAEALGGETVDWAIASHVMEHVPDLVTWLEEVAAVLRPGGSLRLALPDRRYTFDLFRAESRVSEVVDAWLQRARRPTPRMVLDACLLSRDVDLAEAWDGTVTTATARRRMTDDAAIAAGRDALVNGTYHDVHCWVFTPGSFAVLMGDLARLGLVRLACTRLIPTRTGDMEFFVELGAGLDQDAVVASWDRTAAVS